MQQWSRAIRAGEVSSPKTILGFFAIVLAILVGGAVSAAVALGGGDYRFLIPIIFLFVGVVFIVLVAIVVLAMWRDPTRLMLGRMTGREYIDFVRLTQGDSRHGEVDRRFVLPASPIVFGSGPNPPSGSALGEPDAGDEQ